MHETHRSADLVRHALSLRRNGHDHEALVMAEAALKTCREGDHQTLVEVYACLAQLHRDAGRTEMALDWYLKASKAADNQDRFIHALRHIADIECELGNHSEAEAHYTEVLTHYQGEDSLNHANAQRGFAVLMEAINQRDRALSAWRAARGIYERFGIMEGVNECDAHLNSLDQTT